MAVAILLVFGLIWFGFVWFCFVSCRVVSCRIVPFGFGSVRFVLISLCFSLEKTLISFIILRSRKELQITFNNNDRANSVAHIE